MTLVVPLRYGTIRALIPTYEVGYPTSEVPPSTSKMNRCTFLPHACTFLVRRCASEVHRCTFLVRRCTFLVHRCAFLVFACTFLVDRCTSEVGHCTSEVDQQTKKAPEGALFIMQVSAKLKSLLRTAGWSFFKSLFEVIVDGFGTRYVHSGGHLHAVVVTEGGHIGFRSCDHGRVAEI